MPLKADLVLYNRSGQPIAVAEVKTKLSSSKFADQALGYRGKTHRSCHKLKSRQQLQGEDRCVKGTIS